MRLFVGLSLDRSIPDHTTIMNFRHLLERQNLARTIFDDVVRWLFEAGVLLKEGSLMDATIIEALNSIKNKVGIRDPKMHQTKKGNQWHFGVKAHVGVDARTGITHSLTTTAASRSEMSDGKPADKCGKAVKKQKKWAQI
ncbi:transposase, IS5 family [Neptunomonas antarctica]|uniref:Transposase, IS5 family n=1 Tax=Neptunomonas antarctica TaxID=619304 RepID=A0A1N7LMY1_9GAMM|nr:transposase, IS5 family [Neptunomonas antarctica]